MFLTSCNQQVDNNWVPDTRSSAQKAVEDEGYQYIKSNWAIFFSCAKDDSAFTSEEVVAKNSNGKEVTLKVCCGWPLSFKGCTVRH